MKKLILGLLLAINCEFAAGSPKQEYLDILRNNMPIAIIDTKMFNSLGVAHFNILKLDVEYTYLNELLLTSLLVSPSYCQKSPDPCINKFKEVETKRLKTIYTEHVRYRKSCAKEVTITSFNLCMAVANTAFDLHLRKGIGSELEYVKDMILQNIH